MDPNRDYRQDAELIKGFFAEANEIYGPKLTDVANRDAKHFHVNLQDVLQFNAELSHAIASNATRYSKIFYQVVDEILPTYQTKESFGEDTFSIIIEHRKKIAENRARLNTLNNVAQAAAAQNMDPNGPPEVDEQYPPELNRRYELYFIPIEQTTIPIRDVLASQVGRMITVRGLVTRCSDVKPQVVVATYTCNQCGHETFQTVNDPEYTPLDVCTSIACRTVKVPGKLKHQINGSKLIKAQEIKIQELSDQVPTGHIPRAIRVLAHGEITRLCGPGDQIILSGAFQCVERRGFRARNHSGADVFIEAHYLRQISKSSEEDLSSEPMSMEEAKELMDKNPNFINDLSESIAPEIFGHKDLKRALLLLLIGGVERVQSGARTRGDINICLMGDPGVAKSQMLRFINRLATRSQYTTGRGSSGVGLTAAVLKDPITDELTLEGGALVLADQGVCCIDEFDKMLDADRTAIHEVMEQQTVSIAKAGINTILNARVSILAAANPCYGRYNIHRSISDNLKLPPALLSRFDLLWLLKDNTDRGNDRQLADHVSSIHQATHLPEEQGMIDMKTMRRYINLCKLKNPHILPEHEKKLVEIYLTIRKRKRLGDGYGDSLFTSPRSLLAIIRLATALARLRLADHVEDRDIEGAVQLYESSKSTIEGFVSGQVRMDLYILERIKELTDNGENATLFEELIDDIAEKKIPDEDLKAKLEALHKRGSITWDQQSQEIMYTV